MKSNNRATFAVVGSAEWRGTLLSRLSTLDGFDSLAAESRGLSAPTLAERAARLRIDAARIVGSYPKMELAAARQYYNTEQLLRFWRYFNREIANLARLGLITAEFPLFTMQADLERLVYGIKPVGIEYFGTLNTTGNGNGAHCPIQLPAQALHGLDAAGPGYARLSALFNKLLALHRIMTGTVRTYYDIFLNMGHKRNTVAWQCYKIHLFLDHYLYIDASGEPCRADFDHIFFSTNVKPLQFYLSHCLASGATVTLADAEAFLARQRNYYLEQALSLSIEDTEILNLERELIRYVPEKGVTTVCGATDELREFYRQNRIIPYGRIKLSGCPFAKVKGVRGNAVLEVFEMFDRMILHLLLHTEEFYDLFGPSANQATDRMSASKSDARLTYPRSQN